MNLHILAIILAIAILIFLAAYTVESCVTPIDRLPEPVFKRACKLAGKLIFALALVCGILIYR